MKGVILALALVLCACFPNPGVTQDAIVTAYGQVRIRATPLHHAVWLMTVECTGQPRDFEGIRWAVADSLISSDGTEVWGIWTPERLIVLNRGLGTLVGLIAHEIMHDLCDGQIPKEQEQLCTPMLDSRVLLRVLNR